MSKHDVTQSSNPDVQALVGLLKTVARSVAGLTAEVAAIRGELASLPQAYVVPGPQGQVPEGTTVMGIAVKSVAEANAVGGAFGIAQPANPVDPSTISSDEKAADAETQKPKRGTVTSIKAS